MSNVLTFSRHNDYKDGGFKSASRQKRPSGFPPHQYYIENDINIAAPAAEVWEMLARPDSMCRWDHDIHDILTSHEYNQDQSALIGTWRMLFHQDGTVQKQIITEADPGNVFAYTTIKGLKNISPDPRLSVEMHIALFRLFSIETEPGEVLTNVTWLNYLEFSKALQPNIPVQEIMGKLDRVYRRNLIYLKWQVENGSSHLS